MDLAHSTDQHDPKFKVLFKAYESNLAPNVLEMIAKAEHGNIKSNQKQSKFCYETSEVAKRAALNFRRNPVLLRARIIQTAFIAFLTCALYFQLSDDPNNIRNISNRNGALFFLTISQFMTSMSSVLLTFPTERAVFLKENGAGMYSVSAYFFGRSATELPFVTLFPFIFSCIVYWIVGFNNTNPGKFFIFALFNVLQSLAGNAVGLMTGCMFNDPKVASGIAPMAIMPFFAICRILHQY